MQPATPVQRRLSRGARLRALALAAFVATSTSVVTAACNVFVTVERCDSDDECPTGFTCESAGRFCVGPDAGVVDAGGDSTADVVVDATPDTTSPPCDTSAPFGALAVVAGLESLGLRSARFTPDEKTVILSALAPGCEQESCADLIVATRPSLDAPFVVSGPLAGVNTPVSAEYWPTLSADGLLLFFESTRSLTKVDGGYVDDRSRIWSTTRVNTTAEFGEPRVQALFDVVGLEGSPYLHPLGRSLYFMSLARPGKGNLDLFVAKLDPLGLASSIENVSAVNTARAELAPVVSLDEKHLYFAREDEVTTLRDVLRASRADVDAAFGEASIVSELSTADDEFPTFVSSDECRIYFVSDRPSPGSDAGRGAYRLWSAARPKP